MIALVSRTAPDDTPWLDTAISWTLLERTAAGLEPETLRIFRPARVLAFGPADRLSPGYEAARTVARSRGFAPVERLAGGRAVVFHEDTIAFAWTVPDPRARMNIRHRFETMSSLVAGALRRLGVDARVGAVAGEYCPGEYSVNAGGRAKVMGVGQRVLPRAAHLGGVIVVDGADRVRDVLTPVYAALDLAWDPATAGSVRDEIGAVAWDDVVEALLAAVTERFEVRRDALDPQVIRDAHRHEARFGDRATVAAPG